MKWSVVTGRDVFCPFRYSKMELRTENLNK